MSSYFAHAIFAIDAGQKPDWDAVRAEIGRLTVEKWDGLGEHHPLQRHEEMAVNQGKAEVPDTLLGQQQWLDGKKSELQEQVGYVEEMLNVATDDLDVRTIRDADLYILTFYSDPSELFYAFDGLAEAGVIYAAGFDKATDEDETS